MNVFEHLLSSPVFVLDFEEDSNEGVLSETLSETLSEMLKNEKNEKKPEKASFKGRTLELSHRRWGGKGGNGGIVLPGAASSDNEEADS